MNELSTPETDNCAKNIDQSNFENSWKDEFEEFAWVPAEFARQLEHSRDEWAAMCGRYKQERDEAQVAIRALAEHAEVEIQRITKERDEASEQLRMVNIEANARNEIANALKERDEALEESLEQARLLGISGERECRLIAERDEAKKKYDIEATEHMLNINKCCNQRDAAMDVLEEISLYLSSGIGDENTTAQQYKERILDGIKHLAGHAWDERCKYEKLWKEAEDSLMKIEEIFIDGDDTYEDWKSMGQIARTFLEKTYESRTNQNN